MFIRFVEGVFFATADVSSSFFNLLNKVGFNFELFLIFHTKVVQEQIQGFRYFVILVWKFFIQVCRQIQNNALFCHRICSLPKKFVTAHPVSNMVG